jgi:mannose-6-phosphate isomerase-like protein (cupin superfamily)
MADHTCLAYLKFPDAESLGSDRHAHRLHFHRESWEYYVVLQGTRSLQVEDEVVAIDAGEMLAVSPGASHVLHATCTPFEGFTFRVPLVDDKVEYDGLAGSGAA